jgi:hypothetical protein
MNNRFSFTCSETDTALVIVFPPRAAGLFNPEIHGLVREVQERLARVSVRYALTSGSAPTLRDAMAAARFAGCGSIIVVHVLDQTSVGGRRAATAMEAPVFSADMMANEIVGAFTSAVENSQRAA